VLLSRSTDFPQNYCSVERQFAEKERPVQWLGKEPHGTLAFLAATWLECASYSWVSSEATTAAEFGWLFSCSPAKQAGTDLEGLCQHHLGKCGHNFLYPTQGSAGVGSLLTLWDSGTLEAMRPFAQIPSPFPKLGRHWTQKEQAWMCLFWVFGF
jgi:hypothetical protein